MTNAVSTTDNIPNNLEIENLKNGALPDALGFKWGMIVTADKDGAVTNNAITISYIRSAYGSVIEEMISRYNAHEELISLLAEHEEWASGIQDEESRVPLDLRLRTQAILAKMKGVVA